MYFNTLRWAIDINLSIFFVFGITMFLLWRLVKLEKQVKKLKKK